jgi:hypothetical protein
MTNIFNTTGKAQLFAALAIASIAASSNCPSFAGRFAQNHPRRSEVLGRDRNLNRRIATNQGNLGGNFGHLERQDRSIGRQEQRDVRQNGGFITRGQQGQLNREENSLGRETFYDNKNNQFVQNHPRRSEVMGRDANLNYAINKDAGHLGGNYRSLEQQDHSIAQQQRADARANGGYITKPEQHQLNQEESALHQEVKQDYQ